MRGYSHTITGLTVGSAIATVTPDLDPVARINIVFVCAGAALMPDLDHSGATVSRSLGPITQGVSTLTNIVSGGHRKGTHSVFGWLIMGALAYGLSLLYVDAPDWLVKITGIPTLNIGFVCLSAFLWGISGSALGKTSIVLAGIGAIAALIAPLPALWVGVIVAIGAAVHVLLGDILTTAGVPLLFPVSKRNYRFAILGDTGSSRESVYVAVMGVLAIALPIWGYYSGILVL